MRALLAFLLFVTPAFAADSITMTVVSDVPGSTGTITRGYNMSQSDMKKFIDWVMASYKCTPKPPAATCTAFNLNQATTAWMNATLHGTIDNVTRWEKINAATDAAGDVVPINPQ